MRAFLFVLASAFFICDCQAGQQAPPEVSGMKGAKAFIAEFKDASPPLASGLDSQEALRSKLKRFEEKAPSMTPEKAAQAWLGLYYDIRKLNAPSFSITRANDFAPRFVSFSEIAEALPPTSAWDELCKQADAIPRKHTVYSYIKPGPKEDPELPLRLFLYAINGDGKAMLKDLKESKLSDSREKVKSVFDLARELSDPSSAPRVDLERLKALSSLLASSKLKSLCSVKLPAFDASVPDSEIEALAASLLSCDGVVLEAKSSSRVASLARAAALKIQASLKAPQWPLCDASPEGVSLCLASLKLFPVKGRESEAVSALYSEYEKYSFYLNREILAGYYGDDMRSEALTLCVLGLLAQSREAEASDALSSCLADMRLRRYEYYKTWEKRTSSQKTLRALAALFERVLEKDASCLEAWKSLKGVEMASGRAKEFSERCAKALESKALDPVCEAEVSLLYARSLLASDELEKGLSILRSCVLDGFKKELPHDEQLKASKPRCQAALAIASLGDGLNDRAMVSEGCAAALKIRAARKALAPAKRNDPYEGFGFGYQEAYAALFKAGLLSDCEKLLFFEAGERLGASIAKASTSNNGVAAGQDIDEFLEKLVAVYFEAGRFEDVAALVDECPWWNCADIRDLRSWSDGRATSCLVAAAFAKLGRKDDALRVLKSSLLMGKGLDADYSLLCELEGQEAIPFLDGLVKIDRFETRPLIWKAVLFEKAGRLEEAEALAKSAISIDPTDGKSMAGSRLKAYETLAEILRKLGKDKDAELFERIVRSVRIAEAGDKLECAGLLSRSLKLYREANLMFSDAYCIHWRLAKRLLDAGDAPGAMEHFKTAFELMPGQFGRVASFCFGCEGAFDVPSSRSAAEEVLSSLEKAKPESPQIRFLLGELRESQLRWAEAAAEYSKAAELDPDYLDAWSKLYSIRNEASLSQAERDRVLIRLLSLDPAMRHCYPDFRARFDWKGAVSTLEKARAGFPQIQRSCYPLKAAAQRLQSKRQVFWEAPCFEKDILKGPGSILSSSRDLSPLVEAIPGGSL